MKRSLLFLVPLFLAFFIINDVALAQAEFDNGTLNPVLSSYGRLRVYNTGGDPKQIERMSSLVGGAEGQVFDYWNDAGILTEPGLNASPILSDFEMSGTIDNTYPVAEGGAAANFPPDVSVETTVYGWNNSNYLIVGYTVTNIGATALEAYLGVEILPEIDGGYGFETVSYVADPGVVSMNIGASTYLGFYPLSHDLVTVKSIDWYDGYNTEDADLWNNLTAGTVEALYECQSADGVVTFMGFGNAHLEPGASTIYYVGVSVGADQAAMLANIPEMLLMFTDFPTSVEQVDAVPTGFALAQNYPNPFNPTTNINFSIQESGFVSLKVYNTLGQLVAELVNSELNAGNYNVDFNAANLSSGIYMYTLTSGNQSITKKMMLVK